MTENLELLNWSAAYFSRYLLALVRVLGAVSMNPLLNATRAPVPARLWLALFLTFILFPPGDPVEAGVAIGPTVIAGELLIGLLVSFATSLVFGGVQLAASLVSSLSGLNMAGILNPSFDMASGGAAIDQLFAAFALLVFLEINGHYMFIFALRDLFGLVPVGGATQLPMDFETLATLSAGLFGAAVRMVFPVIAALLLADLGLALLARVAPQLNLFALGLPLKVGVAYGALVLALPWIMPQMIGMFRAIPENMLALAR